MDSSDYSLTITKEYLDEYVKLEKIKENDQELYDRFYSYYKTQFEMFRNTRNTLVHNRVNNSDYPLIVSKFMLDSIRIMIKKMSLKAINACTPVQKIKTVDLDTPIYNALILMNESNYSYLPVMQEGKVKYVVSEKAIVSILTDNEEGILFDKDVTLKNYEKYFLLDGNPNEYYSFVDKDRLAFDVRDGFGKIKNNKKCGVVFITQNGKKDESILGMVTLWDIAFSD